MSAKSRKHRLTHGKRLRLVRGAFGKTTKERKMLGLK
jgi:hypothetical protein